MALLIAIVSSLLGSLTLVAVGDLTFYLIPFAMGTFLFLTTFAKRQAPIFSALIGFTISVEIFGTQHPGLASLLAAVVLTIYALFRQKMSFTAPLNRFMLSLLVLITTYNILFFGTDGFWKRQVYLLLAYPVFCVIFAIWHATSYTTHHERP